MASFQLPASAGGPRLSPQPQQWQDYCPPQWGGLPTPGAPPPFAVAAAAGTPPVFYTEAALTLDSPSSSGSPGHCGYGAHGPSPLSQPPQFYGQQHPAQHPAQHPPPPPAPHPAAHQLQQLEQHNAELMHCCAQLQARLEATEQQLQAQAQAQSSAQQSQASPAGSVASGSRGSQQQEQQARPTPGRSRSTVAGEELDPEERALLQRRLSAKQRETEAAAAALTAAQAAAAQRGGELEAERARAAALADEVAHWKDECAQREKEARALAQRLEAATAQCGLLDDSVAALKKKAGELGTVLAQRDVAVRGLEDRLRALQGSEGSRERQLDALQAELEAARGERDAARREAATLQAANAELQAEVQRLDAAVQQARKEQAAALRNGSRDAELIAAAPPQRTSSSGGAVPGTFADGYGGPAYPPQPVAGPAYSQPPASFAGGFGSYAAPAAFDWQASSRPPTSYAPSYASGPPPPIQHYQQEEGFSGRASYAGGPSGAHPTFQRCTPPAAGPASMAAQGRYSDAGSDACSSYGGYRPGPTRAPASSPPPPSWQRAQQDISAGTPVAALAGRIGTMGLHTPASSSSPFATEDTLQSMLRQTQALEDRLLQLNAERNELEAESARMPTHTTGRTQQERRRRAEVEGRLEEINKECSSIRLQLRRLGVK